MITLGESLPRPSAKPRRLKCRSSEGMERERGFAFRDPGEGGGPRVIDRLGIGKGIGVLLFSSWLVVGAPPSGKAGILDVDGFIS